MSKSKKNISSELNDSFLDENKIIFKKYKPIKKIGKGAFSKIYSTIRLDDKSVFAMKTEKRSSFNNFLETEAYYLFILKGLGIPNLISYGHNKKYNILIETLLGKSLYDIFIKPRKPCNITNICLISIQIIERLEFIHSKDIIYRDMKPGNLLIGIKDPNVIYIIDYGLCKKYRSSKTGKHILPKDLKKFVGTLKYASSNVVKGKESSRRDDLISLGFVLIQLYRRNLPWNLNFKDLDKTGYLNIIHSKETFEDGKLFKYLPEEMIDYIKYVNNLRFEQDPDYSFMKGCFQKALMRLNFNNTKINFSWIKSKDNNLMPKMNLLKSHGSRHRILKSLEIFNNSKKNNFDKDSNSINISSGIMHFSKISSDENIKRINENINKNGNKNEYKNKKKINKINKKILNIKNKINPLIIKSNSFIIKNIPNQRVFEINTNKNVYINNNNFFLNNINYVNNSNNNMNFNIVHHRKINTFIPENIIDDRISNINYQIIRRNNNNNYSLNEKKNINYLNKITRNIRHDKINISETKVLNSLNSFHINKRISFVNTTKNKINHFKIIPNKKNINRKNFNLEHIRTKKIPFPNINIIHTHNSTDIY